MLILDPDEQSAKDMSRMLELAQLKSLIVTDEKKALTTLLDDQQKFCCQLRLGYVFVSLSMEGALESIRKVKQLDPNKQIDNQD